MKPKPENKRKIADIPNFVPKFGEISKVHGYNFKKRTWKKLYRKSYFRRTNIFDKLGFYDKRVTREMHNDEPNMKPDYTTPHMGIFNDKNYCHVHDMLIYHNQPLAFKKYYMTDYH